MWKLALICGYWHLSLYMWKTAHFLILVLVTKFLIESVLLDYAQFWLPRNSRRIGSDRMAQYPSTKNDRRGHGRLRQVALVPPEREPDRSVRGTLQESQVNQCNHYSAQRGPPKCTRHKSRGSSPTAAVWHLKPESETTRWMKNTGLTEQERVEVQSTPHPQNRALLRWMF